MTQRQQYEDILFNPNKSIQQVVVLNTKTKYIEKLMSDGKCLATLTIRPNSTSYLFN